MEIKGVTHKAAPDWHGLVEYKDSGHEVYAPTEYHHRMEMALNIRRHLAALSYLRDHAPTPFAAHVYQMQVDSWREQMLRFVIQEELTVNAHEQFEAIRAGIGQMIQGAGDADETVH